mmetsp:Transcript_61870/g.130623  ORF Transcript_61870/g.130623 Transcript_61870/m.130623 type:complete len:444 (+) Transcript_61870:3-1334(+)
MTPVISYWKSNDMLWLDGKGSDGRGACAVDEPESCGAEVVFSGITVSDLEFTFAGDRPSPPPPPPPHYHSHHNNHHSTRKQTTTKRTTTTRSTSKPTTTTGLPTTTLKVTTFTLTTTTTTATTTTTKTTSTGPPATTVPPPPRTTTTTTTFVQRPRRRFAGFSLPENAAAQCNDDEVLPQPSTPAEWEDLDEDVRTMLMQGVLKAEKPLNRCWLGGLWSFMDSEWLWQDLTPIRNIPWATGQPDGGNQHLSDPYLVMDVLGQVHDTSSTAEAAVLCEPKGLKAMLAHSGSPDPGPPVPVSHTSAAKPSAPPAPPAPSSPGGGGGAAGGGGKAPASFPQVASTTPAAAPEPSANPSTASTVNFPATGEHIPSSTSRQASSWLWAVVLDCLGFGTLVTLVLVTLVALHRTGGLERLRRYWSSSQGGGFVELPLLEHGEVSASEHA